METQRSVSGAFREAVVDPPRLNVMLAFHNIIHRTFSRRDSAGGYSSDYDLVQLAFDSKKVPIHEMISRRWKQTAMGG